MSPDNQPIPPKPADAPENPEATPSKAPPSPPGLVSPDPGLSINATFPGAQPPYIASISPANLIAVQQSSSWQGPYPSPDAVERFEAVLPGAFNRILTMAEEAQRSQIKTNEAAQVFLKDDVKRSHYLGATISAVAVVCAAVCGLMDHTIIACALVGVPVMAVARAFLTRSESGSVTKESSD